MTVYETSGQILLPQSEGMYPDQIKEMTFKVKGQQVTQTGAVFTVALQKVAEAWRIVAWAWAKGIRA